MNSPERLCWSPALVLLFLVLIPVAGWAAEADPDATVGRHHLSVTVGYARQSGMGSTTPVSSIWGGTGRPADLQDALDAGIRYRVSLRPGVDLAFETHRIQAAGTEVTYDFEGTSPHASHRTHRTDTWGLGMRRTIGANAFRPFFQVGFVHAR